MYCDGGGVCKLLEWEGFYYDCYIDIFDGGFLVLVWIENICILSESCMVIVCLVIIMGGVFGIVLIDCFEDFCICQVYVVMDGDVIGLFYDVMEVFNLIDGDCVCFWCK